MMNLNEIATSTSALGNQLRAGIPAEQALDRMALLQLNYREFWLQAAASVRSGQRLSASLEAVWPVAMVRAVEVGEQAGKLDDVFTQIRENVALQKQQRGLLRKLLYPVAAAAAGLVGFILYMVFVIPGMAKALGSRSQENMLFQASLDMSSFVGDNWMMLVGGTVSALGMLITWARTDDGKAVLLDFLLAVPYLKEGLRDVFFGVWGSYVAMVVGAGVPTLQALEITIGVLPEAFRESIEAFIRDMAINNRSMADAADINALAPGDPRATWWPFYISNAFIVADQTGTIDKELRLAIPSLVEDGSMRVSMSIYVTTAIMMMLAALLIVSPLAAYYLEVFGALRSAMK